MKKVAQQASQGLALAQEAATAYAEGHFIHVVRVVVPGRGTGLQHQGRPVTGASPEIVEAIESVSAAGWTLQLPLGFATPTMTTLGGSAQSITECWATFFRR
jgi:hypothetical protein